MKLKDLDLFENNNNDILFIEWPQIIKQKPKNLIKLYFEYKNDYQNRYCKILN